MTVFSITLRSLLAVTLNEETGTFVMCFVYPSYGEQRARFVRMTYVGGKQQAG